MNFRVKKKGNVFVIQYKCLFLWWDYKQSELTLNNKSLKYKTLKFNTEKEALQILK